MMLTILAGLAELEVEITRERMEAGRLQAASQGIFPSSDEALPLGYVRGPDGRVIEHADHADMVRLVFELAQGGTSYMSVASELTRRGVRTSRAATWGVVQVRRVILTTTYYTGVIQYRSSVLADQPDAWVPIPAPALVSEGVWRGAQRDRAKNHGRRNTGRYPLTGHLECVCGTPLQGRTNKGKRNTHASHRYYRCMYSNRHGKLCSNGNRERLWDADRTEQSAREQLVAALQDPNALAAYHAKRHAAEDRSAERKDIERKQVALLDLYLEGLVDRDTYTVRRAQLLDALEALAPKPVPLPSTAGLDALVGRAARAEGEALHELADLLDVVYRMNPDGTVRLESINVPTR